MTAFGQALGANFEEPSSPDQTSAPQIPASPQPTQQVSPLLAALQKSKKKQQARKPASLAAAIARAKSARPSARRFG
jgi:hypothetical protein